MKTKPRPRLFKPTASPLLPCPLDLVRLAGALRAHALDQPVAIRGRQFQRFADRDPEARPAVLPPAELKERLAPGLEVYAGEEPQRSRLRAVRPFPGMKNV